MTTKEFTPIIPKHYNEGEIDLIESWYRTYAFNEFRAIMQAYSQRYFIRKKDDRVQDLRKGIYVMERMIEYEIMEKEKDKCLRK